MRYLQSFAISFFTIALLFMVPFPEFSKNSDREPLLPKIDKPKEFSLTNYITIPEKSEISTKDTLIKEKDLSQNQEKNESIDNKNEKKEESIQESKIDDKPSETTTNNPEAIVAKPKNLTNQTDDDSLYSYDSVDYIPNYSKNKKPPYPIAAKRMRQQGQTKLEIIIDRLGNIINVAVSKSSGYLLLDNAAIKAVKQWDLSSAVKLGKKTRVYTTIKFTLREMIEK